MDRKSITTGEILRQSINFGRCYTVYGELESPQGESGLKYFMFSLSITLTYYRFAKERLQSVPEQLMRQLLNFSGIIFWSFRNHQVRLKQPHESVRLNSLSCGQDIESELCFILSTSSLLSVCYAMMKDFASCGPISH